jgi:recombinational DNA repair protein RecT
MSNEKQISVIDNLKPNEKSLMTMVSNYRDKMIKRASDSIRLSSPEKQDQFLARTIASIIKNDNLKECFNSHEGKVSIYMLIDDCLKTGLELDKHAYAVPYSKKKSDGTWVKTASFQIKRQGFHALLCGGLKPIFKDLKWGMVYDKEKNDVKIDRASGEIVHNISITEDRGKPVGCWVQAVKLDGSKEAEFYPVSFINKIRDNHSKTYQDYLAKKVSNCAWITDEIQMIEKTAIKSFCRPYADVVEELANALYSECDEIIENKKDISDIAESIIDNAIDSLNPENNIVVNNLEDDEIIENEKKSLF